MFLIMAGAYIGQELRSEFGKIPPTFLPLGNKRLFQHQLNLIPEGQSIYMSVPETYNISEIDKNRLDEHNVKVVEIPDDLSLGQSLVVSLNLISKPLEDSLHILFGDTLLKTLPEGDDVIATSKINDSYDWSAVSDNSIDWLSESKGYIDDLQNNIVCGYFKFSQPRILIRSIIKAKWFFLEGLNRYHNDIGITSVHVNNWLDFGHVNTYYHSKAEFTTQRSFNNLVINSKWIEKSSFKNKKIKAEANWFSSIPAMMQRFVPQFLGEKYLENGHYSYKLEYLHNTALNELFVFSEVPDLIWNKIINHCLDFIDECFTYEAPLDKVSTNIDQLFGEKTNERLNEFEKIKNIGKKDIWSFNNTSTISIDDILELSNKWLPTTSQASSLMHGDFCFSNILYDFRTDRVKTIDPRGLTPDGEITIYGDVRYDLAKLSHSILGMYDWIISGYYSVNIDYNKKSIELNIDGESKHKETQALFIELVEIRYGLTALNLYAMQLQLFLSMLPLHVDDKNRQDALFANAFRLYELMKGYEK
ncbi:capsular biosynthesis protein [Vibrio lentus]|uniref:Capsular biosynthesis protein n=1 Tax=Vibrio lentus TaxID=136468 RepID=A0A2N7KEF2_9VIBR|nr:capsular biosynthesis protein [Vibrio lentus]PMM74061.1 capsular biosynthesis protein [Vibrio lentus]